LKEVFVLTPAFCMWLIVIILWVLYMYFAKHRIAVGMVKVKERQD